MIVALIGIGVLIVSILGAWLLVRRNEEARASDTKLLVFGLYFWVLAFLQLLILALGYWLLGR